MKNLSLNTNKIGLLTTTLLVYFGLTACSVSDSQQSEHQSVLIGSCGSEAKFISQIQGTAATSIYLDKTVVVEAIVTAIAPQLGGYYLQEETAQFDQDPQSSEGLFVYRGEDELTVKPGQLVRVKGKVGEFKERTQLSSREPALFCSNQNAEPVTIEVPDNALGYEPYEGMLVQFAKPMTVISSFNLSRFGELEVSDQKLFNPTHMHLPGSVEALALAERNQHNRIILDDFNQGAPDSINLYGALSSKQSIRVGTQVLNINGVLDESFNAYRVRLLSKPELERAERPEKPEINGDLVITAFNVLNLFNGDGKGGAFPTDQGISAYTKKALEELNITEALRLFDGNGKGGEPQSRGAKTLTELALQKVKIVTAILELNPDIIGLNEIENDGNKDEFTAVAQLTQALNSATGSDVYAYLAYDMDLSGASIANAIIYRTDKVRTNGELKVLTADNSATDDIGPLFNTRKSRPAITQAFTDLKTGNDFVVSVNHLKSKGSSCGENDDTRDQGNCNGTRTRAAQGLANWLDEQYPDMPIFIIGDLNSYAMEDPIRALNDAGYTDMVRKLHGNETYTFSFRGQLGALDYVMANPNAEALVQSAYEWRINASEPRILDYNALLPNTEDVKPEQLISSNVFRSSDHDPVVFGISFDE